MPALLYMIGANGKLCKNVTHHPLNTYTAYTTAFLCALTARKGDTPTDSENPEPVEVGLPQFNNPGTLVFSTVEHHGDTFPSHVDDESIKVLDFSSIYFTYGADIRQVSADECHSNING